MLSLCNVSAWIEVDGKELEQYGIEEDFDRSQVTCWIASQAGKSFSVAFKDNAVYREHSLASCLQFDGSSISGRVLRQTIGGTGIPNLLTRTRTVVQNGRALSATSARPFIFSKLELTDEDEDLNQASAHLGEIRIDIYRVLYLGSRELRPDSGVPGHGKVHERSKKAVSHCVSYGQEVKTETKHSCQVTYLDGNTPLVTFIFKYRDFSLLQANGIIPEPPPAEERAAVSDAVLDLTTDDDVKPEPGDEIEIVDNTTQKRTAALQSKRSNTSHESEARPGKRVKREKKIVHTGEVIDLT